MQAARFALLKNTLSRKLRRPEWTPVERNVRFRYNNSRKVTHQ